jgi:hypothetical protein
MIRNGKKERKRRDKVKKATWEGEGGCGNESRFAREF